MLVTGEHGKHGQTARQRVAAVTVSERDGSGGQSKPEDVQTQPIVQLDRKNIGKQCHVIHSVTMGELIYHGMCIVEHVGAHRAKKILVAKKVRYLYNLNIYRAPIKLPRTFVHLTKKHIWDFRTVITVIVTTLNKKVKKRYMYIQCMFSLNQNDTFQFFLYLNEDKSSNS